MTDLRLSAHAVRKCCSECGGENVRVDAWAEWDVQAQRWELHSSYDNTWCEDCECEVSIVDRPSAYPMVKLPCQTRINWLGMGERTIIDCHARRDGMLLLVTDRGEFDIPRGQMIAADEVLSELPDILQEV